MAGDVPQGLTVGQPIQGDLHTEAVRSVLINRLDRNPVTICQKLAACVPDVGRSLLVDPCPVSGRLRLYRVHRNSELFGDLFLR